MKRLVIIVLQLVLFLMGIGFIGWQVGYDLNHWSRTISDGNLADKISLIGFNIATFATSMYFIIGAFTAKSIFD